MKTSGAGRGLAGAILVLLFCHTLAEICPADKPDPNASKATKDVAAMKTMLLKPKSCPDFKDSAEQKHCCPSRITYGTYYCCTGEQLREIEEEISAERRRDFIKQNLAIIVIFTIVMAIVALVVTSILCRKYQWCPLHDTKELYSTSSSFPASGSHSALGSRYYRPVEQAPPVQRNSQTFAPSLSMTLNQSKPHMTQWVDAPPPYDSIRHQMCTGVSQSAQRQHDFNCIMENQLNQLRDSNTALDRQQPHA